MSEDDSPLDDGDDLLLDEDVVIDQDLEKDEAETSVDEQHAQQFLGNRYPSANACATRHVKQYKEWSSRSTPMRS